MLDWELLYRFAGTVDYSDQISMDELNLEATKDALWTLIEQGAVLAQKYDVVVTNPPYMGASGMGAKLSDYVKKNFPDSKADMFAVFIERCGQMAKKNGYQAMITQPSFLFLTSFERLREKTVTTSSIENLLHMGRGIFGIDFGSIAFVIKKRHLVSYKGVYLRLHERTFQYIEPKDIAQLYIRAKENHSYRYSFVDYTTDDGIVEQPVTPNSKQIYYEASQDNFSKIPGSPVAYWASNALLRCYENGTPLGQIAAPRKGNSTSDNNRFLRLWFEVDINKENYGCKQLVREETLVKRWFPYNKGGGYKKWYGYNEYMIDWYDDAAAIRAIKTAVIANYQYFMKPGLTWSTVTSGGFSLRKFGHGYIFDNGGCCVFELGSKTNYILGVMNSIVFKYIFGQSNPTINSQSGEVAKFPVIIEQDNRIDTVVDENVAIAKMDWDSYETSWDFKRNPLV